MGFISIDPNKWSGPPTPPGLIHMTPGVQLQVRLLIQLTHTAYTHLAGFFRHLDDDERSESISPMWPVHAARPHPQNGPGVRCRCDLLAFQDLRVHWSVPSRWHSRRVAIRG